MRSRKNLKVSSPEIQARARELLLPLFTKSSSHRCSPLALLEIVLAAAAGMTSIFATCLRRKTISDQTARQALRARLPRQRIKLEAILNGALHQLLPYRTLKRRCDLAVDYHEIPYHGKSPKNHVVGRKPRSGTTKFFAYATVCVVDQGHRYTLACTWVRAEDATVAVVERLLDEVEKSGVKIRRILLDRGFFSVAVMSLLKGRDINFLMPVVMRGRKPARGKKPKGWRIFLSKNAGWHRYTHRYKGEEVAVKVCVTYRSFRHHRTKKRCNQKLVFAAWGVSDPPRQIRQDYRKRFGIESSYRQLGQTRIRTSTRDPLMRLFYVGLSLLLRNIWVWLLAECFGEDTSSKAKTAAKRIPFKWMAAVLIEGIQDHRAFLELLT